MLVIEMRLSTIEAVRRLVRRDNLEEEMSSEQSLWRQLLRVLGLDVLEVWNGGVLKTNLKLTTSAELILMQLLADLMYLNFSATT